MYAQSLGEQCGHGPFLRTLVSLYDGGVIFLGCLPEGWGGGEMGGGWGGDGVF